MRHYPKSLKSLQYNFVQRERQQLCGVRWWFSWGKPDLGLHRLQACLLAGTLHGHLKSSAIRDPHILMIRFEAITPAPTAAPTLIPATPATFTTYSTGQWCKDTGSKLDNQYPSHLPLAEAECESRCSACNGFVHPNGFSCSCQGYLWSPKYGYKCHHFSGNPTSCTSDSKVSYVKVRAASAPTSEDNRYFPLKEHIFNHFVTTVRPSFQILTKYQIKR